MDDAEPKPEQTYIVFMQQETQFTLETATDK